MQHHQYHPLPISGKLGWRSLVANWDICTIPAVTGLGLEMLSFSRIWPLHTRAAQRSCTKPLHQWSVTSLQLQCWTWEERNSPPGPSQRIAKQSISDEWTEGKAGHLYRQIQPSQGSLLGALAAWANSVWSCNSPWLLFIICYLTRSK